MFTGLIRAGGISLIGILMLGRSNVVRADCPPIDFEDWAVGTIITTQYNGVTFSAPVSSGPCAGNALIVSAIGIGGTSSGNRALGTIPAPGCEFHPEFLRMVFAVPHIEVTFTLGPTCGNYVVRAYSVVSGGSPISTQTVSIPDCTAWHGVHRFVQVYSAAGAIRRIEIDAGEAVGETIDDLTFASDSTPPNVYIDSPAMEACVCGTVQITGVSCETDGDYWSDWAEYLRVDAPPGTAWTQIGQFYTELCSPGTLYSWNTAALPHGRYYVKVTAQNDCGLVASDMRVVYVDKSFDTVQIRFPQEGQIIAGLSCMEGTVWDWLCFDEYTVQYRQQGGGIWKPVDPLHSTYTATVVNDPFATWVTTGDPDGSYQLSVQAVDDCGNTATAGRIVIFDNTPPTALLSESLHCAFVDGVVPIIGTAQDANLDNWVLQYSGGDVHTWATIAGGNTPVNNGVLANWDTSSLPPCAYALRLVVYDRAVRDCNSALRQYTEHVVSVNVGATCDINHDGLINGLDVQPFVTCLLGG